MPIESSSPPLTKGNTPIERHDGQLPKAKKTVLSERQAIQEGLDEYDAQKNLPNQAGFLKIQSILLIQSP